MFTTAGCQIVEDSTQDLVFKDIKMFSPLLSYLTCAQLTWTLFIQPFFQWLLSPGLHHDHQCRRFHLLDVCSCPLSPLLRGIFYRFVMCVFSLVCIVVFTMHIVPKTEIRKQRFDNCHVISSNQAGTLMLKHVLE